MHDITHHISNTITNKVPTSQNTVSGGLTSGYFNEIGICYCCLECFAPERLAADSVLVISTVYIYLFNMFLVKGYDGILVALHRSPTGTAVRRREQSLIAFMLYCLFCTSGAIFFEWIIVRKFLAFFRERDIIQIFSV